MIQTQPSPRVGVRVVIGLFAVLLKTGPKNLPSRTLRKTSPQRTLNYTTEEIHRGKKKCAASSDCNIR